MTTAGESGMLDAIVLWVVAVVLSCGIVQSLRAGKIMRVPIRREVEPVAFWLHVLMFSLASAVVYCVAVVQTLGYLAGE